MNSLQVSFAVIAVVVVIFAQSGEALKCHICNSGDMYEGEACADPLETDEFLLDCNKYGEENSQKEYVNATLCRKIVQTIDGDFRIVRSCAQEGRTDRCVERTGTKLVKVTYCECEGNGCNTGSTITLSALTLLMSAVLATFARS